MSTPDDTDPPVVHPPHEAVRPIGTWVVSGFLLAVVLSVWVLVSVVFMHRA